MILQSSALAWIPRVVIDISFRVDFIFVLEVLLLVFGVDLVLEEVIIIYVTDVDVSKVICVIRLGVLLSFLGVNLRVGHVCVEEAGLLGEY